MTSVIEPCELRAGDLLLRPWMLADAPQIATIAADPSIAEWNPVGIPTAEEWCAKRADWSEGNHASWAIVAVCDRSAVLGAASLHHIDLEQLNSEVGYWVAHDHRRRGLATRGVKAATAYGFDTLGLHRVHLFHAVENAGSCLVAEGAGFRYEGTHRESYRIADGPWQTEHSHGRLRTD